MTDQRDHLYGLPGAERLHFSAAEVYECEIDGQHDEDTTSWTIEKWTTRSPITTVPSAEAIVDHVLEYTCDDDYPECPWGDDHPIKDPELLALAEKLRERVAATLGTYRLADKPVGSHVITLVETDDPKYPTVLLDGEPMYVPRELTVEELRAVTDRQLTPAEILRVDPFRTCELEDGTQLNGYAAMEQWQKLAKEA